MIAVRNFDLEHCHHSNLYFLSLSFVLGVHVASVQGGEIRLHSDVNNGQGAVEIYTIQYGWSSICPDGFDDSDAAVLCRKLGYDGGTSRSYRQVYMYLHIFRSVCM